MKRLLFLDFEIPYLLKDSNYPVGGACVRQYAFAEGLTKSGYAVGILTWKGANKYVGSNFSFELVESYSLNSGIKKLRWFYLRAPLIYRAIKRYKPNFLFQKCAGNNTGLIALLSKLTNTPFIYISTNDIDADGRYKEKLPKYTQILFNWGIKHTSGIICQNYYQYSNFKNKFPSKKITIIHNPYFLDKDLPRLKEKKERSYIAWVGIFQHQKNIPVLYDIVRNTPYLNYKIAGKAGSIIDNETKVALDKLHECKNVEFVGYIKRHNIYSFLSNSLALLNTSYYEGFSNTFIESFLSGTPVIATKDVDPDNIIQKNNLGWIVNNYEEIPEIINKIYKVTDYSDISRNCKEYVLKNHDPILLSKKFGKFLELI
jgi:glycosyltransferase involved in cell wall biosynthesis